MFYVKMKNVDMGNNIWCNVNRENVIWVNVIGGIVVLGNILMTNDVAPNRIFSEVDSWDETEDEDQIDGQKSWLKCFLVWKETCTLALKIIKKWLALWHSRQSGCCRHHRCAVKMQSTTLIEKSLQPFGLRIFPYYKNPTYFVNRLPTSGSNQVPPVRPDWAIFCTLGYF